MNRVASFLAAVLAVVSVLAEARPTARSSQAKRPATTAKATTPVNPHRRSPYVGALVIDATDGRVLVSDRAEVEAYPASVTKLMTAFLVLDDVTSGKLRLSDPVTVSPVTSATDRWLRQPSNTGLPAGAQMTVDELLRALMVHSANDAAIFLAEKCSGSWPAFVERMNAKARQLGMTKTAYYNPNGLPPAPGAKERRFNVSTCVDQAKLARALLKDHPNILTYTSLKTWRPTCLGQPMMVTDPRTKTKVPCGAWINHNNVMVKDKLKVINTDGTEAVDGLKTGYIDAGGSSVVITGHNHDRRVIVVVLGSASAAERDAAARGFLTDALGALSY